MIEGEHVLPEDRTYFVVVADADSLGADLPAYWLGVGLGIFKIGHPRQKTTAHTQVQRRAVGGVEFHTKNGRESCPPQPFDDPARLWTCGQTTGVSKKIMSVTRMQDAQLFQQIPGSAFADAKMAVVRLVLLLMPGNTNAKAEPCGDYREEYADLRFR